MVGQLGWATLFFQIVWGKSRPTLEVGQGAGYGFLEGKEVGRVLGLLAVEVGVASSRGGKTSAPPPWGPLSSLSLSCFRIMTLIAPHLS